jgi:hypothetical protein
MLSQLLGKSHDYGNLAVTVDNANHSPFSGKAERNLGIFRYKADAFPDALLGKILFKFIFNEKGGASIGEIPQLAHHLPFRKEEPVKKKRDIKTGPVLGEFNAGRFSSIYHEV